MPQPGAKRGGMTDRNIDIDARVVAHKRRSRRAKWIARLLFPVCGMTISAALWSDPDIAKHLQRGLKTFSDVAAGGDRALGPDDAVNVTPFSKSEPARKLPTISFGSDGSGAKRVVVRK